MYCISVKMSLKAQALKHNKVVKEIQINVLRMTEWRLHIKQNESLG